MSPSRTKDQRPPLLQTSGERFAPRAFSPSSETAGIWPAPGSVGGSNALAGSSRGWEPPSRVRQKVVPTADRTSSAEEGADLGKPGSEFSFSRASAPRFAPETLQRFVGAKGTNQAGEVIPVTLNEEFTGKHVAGDVSGAIEKTQARIEDDKDLGGKMIKEGKVGNTVATKEVWSQALDDNPDEIPADFVGPDAKARKEEDFDAAVYDDSGYSGNSSYMPIKGWDVRLEDKSLKAENTTMNRRVAGSYEVSDLDVSIDINHATQ